jgi:hypothetical protein
MPLYNVVGQLAENVKIENIEAASQIEPSFNKTIAAAN